MKNLKVNLFSVFVPIMEVIIAFLLITSPTGLMRGIVTTIGLCLIICGVGNIPRYFKADAQTAALQQNLAKGIVQAVAGLLLGVWSEAVISIFPAMTVVFGIGLILSLWQDIDPQVRNTLFENFVINSSMLGYQRLRPCPVLDNPGRLTELVEKSGAKSTNYQNPESAKEFSDKCVSAAEKWAPVAERLWSRNKCEGCGGCHGGN